MKGGSSVEENILYSINEQATKFYQDQLSKSEQAQNYLKQRNINEESIKNFKIGFSGTEDELFKYLIQNGYITEQIESTKLCVKNVDGKYVDKYKNRIIFPIANQEDKIIALASRAIDDSTTPKYINGAETAIYTKSDNLYGINIAKDYCKDKLILVEGYIDVISLHQRGIKNVVALLGISISGEQIQLIKQYTNNVVCVFNSDNKGNIARFKVLELLNLFNIKSEAICTTGAKDADEYINKYGTEEFTKLANNAMTPLQFKRSIDKR